MAGKNLRVASAGRCYRALKPRALPSAGHFIAEQRAGRSAEAGRQRIAAAQLIPKHAADYAAGQALRRARVLIVAVVVRLMVMRRGIGSGVNRRYLLNGSGRVIGNDFPINGWSWIIPNHFAVGPGIIFDDFPMVRAVMAMRPAVSESGAGR